MRARTRGLTAPAVALVARITTIVTAVAVAVVLLGGSGAWLVERSAPGGQISSWGDGLWWAITTLTTTGYGDHVPVTLAGRLIAAAVMVAGVAVLGAVAATVPWSSPGRSRWPRRSSSRPRRSRSSSAWRPAWTPSTRD